MQKKKNVLFISLDLYFKKFAYFLDKLCKTHNTLSHIINIGWELCHSFTEIIFGNSALPGVVREGWKTPVKAEIFKEMVLQPAQSFQIRNAEKSSFFSPFTRDDSKTVV